jgi:hypothetical protein
LTCGEARRKSTWTSSSSLFNGNIHTLSPITLKPAVLIHTTHSPHVSKSVLDKPCHTPCFYPFHQSAGELNTIWFCKVKVKVNSQNLMQYGMFPSNQQLQGLVCNLKHKKKPNTCLRQFRPTYQQQTTAKCNSCIKCCKPKLEQLLHKLPVCCIPWPSKNRLASLLYFLWEHHKITEHRAVLIILLCPPVHNIYILMFVCQFAQIQHLSQRNKKFHGIWAYLIIWTSCCNMIRACWIDLHH